MKILYVITGLAMGGAEMQLLLMSKKMLNSGHKVHVVAMKSGVMRKNFVEAGIPLTELRISGPISALMAIWSTFKIIREFSPDVVHSHMVHANLFVRLLRLVIPMKRLVCTAHNINEGGRLLMKAYRITDSLADLSTNVSQEALEHFIEIKAFKAKSSEYVPNAIDTSIYCPKSIDKAEFARILGFPESAFVFLSVGRLHSQKNFPLLLRAVYQVAKSNPLVRLLIVGEGILEVELRQQCRALNIESNVRFLGRRDDIDLLMNYSDCFVLTSDYEGFGLVVAEAMAVRLPVIATNCGGVREVLGGTGKLVPVGDESSLVYSMKSALENNLSSELDRDRGRSRILTNYSVDKVSQLWLRIYRSSEL